MFEMVQAKDWHLPGRFYFCSCYFAPADSIAQAPQSLTHSSTLTPGTKFFVPLESDITFS